MKLIDLLNFTLALVGFTIGSEIVAWINGNPEPMIDGGQRFVAALCFTVLLAVREKAK